MSSHCLCAHCCCCCSSPSHRNAICKVLPDAFDFFPRSFLLPAESVELQTCMDRAPKNATFIAKPRTLCQGKGISLVQSFAKVPKEPCVVQRYGAFARTNGGPHT